MSKDPITKKARELQRAMTNAFLSDAPNYSWCRLRVTEDQEKAWYQFSTFLQQCIDMWRERT